MVKRHILLDNFLQTDYTHAPRLGNIAEAFAAAAGEPPRSERIGNKPRNVLTKRLARLGLKGAQPAVDAQPTIDAEPKVKVTTFGVDGRGDISVDMTRDQLLTEAYRDVSMLYDDLERGYWQLSNGPEYFLGNEKLTEQLGSTAEALRSAICRLYAVTRDRKLLRLYKNIDRLAINQKPKRFGKSRS